MERGQFFQKGLELLSSLDRRLARRELAAFGRHGACWFRGLSSRFTPGEQDVAVVNVSAKE
jgi:hypothetical protein